MSKHRAFFPSALLAMAMCGVTAPSLAQDAAEGEETTDVIVVRGAFVPDEKRSTSEISSLLDADDFARTGDTDIASALRRITGISIVGGRFPVARGLNERYATTTLNGVPLPSPEPLRRAAPLDLVPTRILEGTAAQKTFSPEFSGEFGGAAIDLRTLGVPTENFLNVTGGLEADTETTFRDGLFYEGSDTDRWGFDDGVRDLPAVAAAASRGEEFDPLELSKSFDHHRTAVQTVGEIPVNGSASFTAGRVFVDNSDIRFGGTLFVGYENDWQRRDAIEERSRIVSNIGTSNAEAEEYEETRHEVAVNAFNTLGVEFGSDHEISLTSFLLRSSLKRARIGSVSDRDILNEGGGTREFTDYVEREVWQTQLGGEHFFPQLLDLSADWKLAYGESSRDAPYERTLTRLDDEVTFTTDGGTEETRVFQRLELNSQAPTYNEINFSQLDDENVYASVDFDLPLIVADRELDLSFGGGYTDTERATARQTFQLAQASPNVDFAQSLLPFIEGARVDYLFSDDVFDLGLFQFVPLLTDAFPDQSVASLEVYSGYGTADFQLTDFLRFSAGARYEDGTQVATAFQSGSDAFDIEETIEEDYVLPAVSLTWNPVGNLQLRAGYSQTIARPQFRELVPTVFLDPEFSVEVIGNPFLENSELENFDIRGEYYFRNGEFVTIGAFYKDIENPIERAFLADEGNTTTFVNVPAANIYGIEFEFEKRFDLYDFEITPEFMKDKTFVFNTNYTYSQSELDVSADDQILVPSALGLSTNTRPATTVLDPDRSLVGQSDHLFNAQVGLENPDTNLRATLLVNWASDRILFGEQPTAGEVPLPAVIENPPVTIDFVFGRDFTFFDQTVGFGFKAQNLAGEPFQAYREFDTEAYGGEVPFLAFDRGRIFSASLSYDF